MALAGQGISRNNDLESGHDCWFPVPIIAVPAGKPVLVNKIQAALAGNITTVHVCGKKPPHPDKAIKGSKKVWINKKMTMRIGDPLTGGAVMASGSHSVLAL
ncbi:hypothetical protein T040910_080 [Synechococcus phage S-CAM3]|uniref:Uncharacterized protein n=1 Tax=Synechococcus phage S-CAM3 TaxID=1883366 RepID=A0A1D8KIU4_9CAUD|nr:PAAR motif of membran proteins [Synechococcus phage S-CAM3]AOV58585.1 hypothetical protein S250808_080 [Synechococcus phage S-CAM3]AOV58824.1 hypothetical protein T040910_080 [Synechococcus phage S-CAM3]AOV59063.1 hypothetical protein C421010_080 [Synechococcus phage S-CAM3]